MREKIENVLSIEVSGIDLTAITNIEFYVKQDLFFRQYVPTVISASEMTVRIPFEDAKSLKQGNAKLQFAFVDRGAPMASEVEIVCVGDLLKNAGYAP